MEKQKQPKEKLYIVFYNGNAGKKADSELSAVTIAKDYMKKKKLKKAEIYKLVKKVE